MYQRMCTVFVHKCNLFNYSFLMAGEDGALEVKSLEQIQRDKALRSMGLIELKGGKIMKIGTSQIIFLLLYTRLFSHHVIFILQHPQAVLPCIEFA